MTSVSTISQWLAAVGTAMLLMACGTSKPVFYPNDHFNTVGRQQADADAAQCMADAQAYGAGNDKTAQKVGGSAAKGAVIGAATGAVVSAVLGGSVGRAAGAGAAGGGTAGAIGSAFNADEPDSVYRGYVERCLMDKGYDVIGWK